MSIYDPNLDQSLARIDALEKELANLKASHKTLDIQNKILKGFISLTNVSAGRMLIKATLQKTMEASIHQTGAQLGSLFLLDGDGRVTESILARGATDQSQKKNIVGQVLDKGLAGWVRENKRTGLINDTTKDYRWLKLPDEPYQALSALGVPIVWGEELLGILTLMHSQVNHFTPACATAMEKTAELIALVLNNARIQSKHKQNETLIQQEDDLLNQAILWFPSIIFVLDNQGVLLKCGATDLAQIGLDSKESIGKSIYYLLPEANELKSLTSHALANNIIESVSVQLERVDHGTWFYDAWFSPILDNHGQVANVVCILLPA
mgnify:CR=1 FL=1